MQAYKSKFIYPIFLVFLLISIFMGGILVLIVLKLPGILLRQVGYKDVLAIFGLLLLFSYFFLMGGHLTLILKHGLSITDRRIVLIDYLLFKKEDISTLIKGYSLTTSGGMGSTKNNTVILYLNDGRKINLQGNMFFNFKELESHLVECNIIFLGEEPFIWKNIIQRKYMYG